MIFIKGNKYRRTEIHAEYGGQRQGGISTPAKEPYVFLFTGASGNQHGYEDGWSDGVFCYFGEGQSGDMRWNKGNIAIRDHVKNGKQLLLFKILKQPRSFVEFVGHFNAGSWENRKAPDTSGELRNAIVFHLISYENDIHEDNIISEITQQNDISSLRNTALKNEEIVPKKSVANSLIAYIQRSAAVKNYALARANGRCENCFSPAPFKTKTGMPYLEVHHITSLSDGGPDKIDHVAAICPNCHRNAHFGISKDEINKSLLIKIQQIENIDNK